jgi:3-isopropylmalate/(R)-2-methylmalate dehydratase small subunit
MSEPFPRLVSRTVVLPMDNIDTDQIIPARFLKTISKEGLGDQLFYDWRYTADGKPRADFVLNHPLAKGVGILLAGDNFGCGSSREHAPWALADYGFRAIISTSFADIFRNNCMKNGIIPVQVDKSVHERLFQVVAEAPSAEATLDLASQSLILPGSESVSFPIDPFSKKCLLEGLDDLGYILQFRDRIAAYEAARR